MFFLRHDCIKSTVRVHWARHNVLVHNLQSLGAFYSKLLSWAYDRANFFNSYYFFLSFFTFFLLTYLPRWAAKSNLGCRGSFITLPDRQPDRSIRFFENRLPLQSKMSQVSSGGMTYTLFLYAIVLYTSLHIPCHLRAYIPLSVYVAHTFTIDFSAWRTVSNIAFVAVEHFQKCAPCWGCDANYPNPRMFGHVPRASTGEIKLIK